MTDDNADKTELARERTDFSEDRTVLANERTLAGWIRTAYAGIGIALAFNALFSRIDPPWIPKLIATSFLVIAVIIFITADRRASAVFSRLDTHNLNRLNGPKARMVTIANVLATAALILAIWLLTFKPPSP